MSIRQKIVFFFLGMMLIVIGVVPLLANEFILKSFNRLESSYMLEDIHRSTDALNDQVRVLDTKLTDWSNWDETAKFVTKRNQAYIDSNLSADTLVNLNLDAMLFYNTKHQLMYSIAVDTDGDEVATLPADVQRAVSAQSSVVDIPAKSDGVRGILMAGSQAVIMGARPILDSSGEGPSYGTLVFIQNLSEQTQRLASITHLSLNFFALSGKNTPADLTAEHAAIVQQRFVVNPLNQKSIAGYGLLDDINGHPALVARIVEARSIHDEGMHALRYFGIYFAAAALLVCVAALLLIEFNIVRRITRLARNVAEIDVSNTELETVASRGNDEVSSLGNAINALLKRLYDSHSLEQRNQRLSERVAKTTEELDEERQNLRKQLAEAQRMNQIMVNRELKMIELKKRLATYEDTDKHDD